MISSFPSDIPRSDCPSVVQLRELSEGRLSPEALGAIAEHLESCDECDATLQMMFAAGDTIADCLKRRDPLEAFRGEPELLDIISDSNVGSRTVFELKQIGHYLLLEQIGAGGMGVVYKARDTNLDCMVAIKLINERYSQDAAAVERFRREQQALGQLNHPHIVRARTAGVQGDIHYLVMDYVGGVDLAHLVRQLNRLSVSQACEIVRQTAMGLEYLRQNRQVHRDLKPSNLMLDLEGQVHILDLGLARFGETAAALEELTSQNCLLGTVDFMAPEQASDPSRTDIRSDIYSLGCTMYVLLTGQVLYPSDKYRTVHSKIVAHATAPVPDLSEHRPDVPAPLVRLFERMVAKDLNERCASPAEVAEFLAHYAAGANLRELMGQIAADTVMAGPAHTTFRPLPSGSKTSKPRTAKPSRHWPRGLSRKTVAVALATGFLGLASAIYYAMEPPNSTGDDPSLVASEAVAGRLPRKWYGLLETPPEQIIFPQGTDTARMWYNPDAQEVTVDTDGLALLRLGTTDAGNFILRTRIQRNTWEGVAGLFWGYPEEDAETDAETETDVSTYQAIVVVSHINQEGQREHNLRRELHEVTFVKSAALVNKRRIGPSIPLEPLAGEECPLEIQIKNGRLQQVLWRGRPIEALIDLPPHLAISAYPACRGGFGVLNVNGTASFRSSELMILEKESE